jgi:hypothetical protein
MKNFTPICSHGLGAGRLQVCTLPSAVETADKPKRELVIRTIAMAADINGDCRLLV